MASRFFMQVKRYAFMGGTACSIRCGQYKKKKKKSVAPRLLYLADTYGTWLLKQEANCV